MGVANGKIGMLSKRVVMDKCKKQIPISKSQREIIKPTPVEKIISNKPDPKSENEKSNNISVEEVEQSKQEHNQCGSIKTISVKEMFKTNQYLNKNNDQEDNLISNNNCMKVTLKQEIKRTKPKKYSRSNEPS